MMAKPDKGLEFEYLAGAYFQGDRYFVRNSIPLRTGKDSTPASDVDLMGFRFSDSFALQKVLCDCKNKARAKPYERILWAKGLGAFLEASQTYLAIAHSSLEIAKFANLAEVRVLSLDSIKSALSHRSKRGVPYGQMDLSLYQAKRPRLLNSIQKDKGARELWNAALFLYLTSDPYVGLNDAIFGLSQTAAYLSTASPASDELECWRYIAAEYMTVATLQFLQILSDVAPLGTADRATIITERLTYGHLAPDKAKELFALARELTLQTNDARSGTSPSVRDDFHQSIQPPPYAADIVGLAERAYNLPEIYCEVLQYVDFLLFDQALTRGRFSEEDFVQVFGTNNVSEKLKVTRNIFSFLRDAAGVNMRAFWSSRDNREIKPVTQADSVSETLDQPKPSQELFPWETPGGEEMH